MSYGKTQAMLEAAVASPASLVVVLAHNDHYAQELMLRLKEMIQGKLLDYPKEYRFMSLDTYRRHIRLANARVFTDHYALEGGR